MTRSELDPKLEALASALREIVDLQVGADASFDSREVALLEAMDEAGRRCLQRELQERSDRLAEEVLVAGVRHRRHTSGIASYFSLCGTLQVQRWTYREVGVRKGVTVVAVELAAGLMESATPALARSVCLGFAKTHMRSHREDLVAAGRRPPSRSKLERMAKALGTEAKAAAPRIESYIRLAERPPETAAAISVGIDRTAVAMEEDRQEGRPPRTRRKTRSKPRVRKAPAPVDVNWRMAYVATVCITDEDGEGQMSRKYAASAHEGPDGILRRVAADVRNFLRHAPGLHVGLVQDGAPEMWNLGRSALRDIAAVAQWSEGIDRYHLNERLGEILQLVESNATERERQMSEWNDALDNRDDTIDHIEQWLTEEVGMHSGKRRKQLDAHLTYITNNKDRMRYVSLSELGLPVGSGVTEGACGSVVGRRTKGGGRRWRPEGLDAALTLRSIHCSGRWQRFSEFLCRRYTKEIRPVA